MLRSEDSERVRVLTLARPEALNAFNEALYDALTDALADALDDPSVAVVVLTGKAGPSAPAPTCSRWRNARRPRLRSRASRVPRPDRRSDRIREAVGASINGLGLGIGATIIGLSDLAFMSSTARLRCPFTDLAVAPEAASSYTFPMLLGRQRAAWALLSSEWLSADECLDLGLVFRVCQPDELLRTTMTHARLLASKPISSLRATKRLMTAHHADAIAAARNAEDAAFQVLMAGPANKEALAAFAEKRTPDFTNLPPGW